MPTNVYRLEGGFPQTPNIFFNKIFDFYLMYLRKIIKFSLVPKSLYIDNFLVSLLGRCYIAAPLTNVAYGQCHMWHNTWPFHNKIK